MKQIFKMLTKPNSERIASLKSTVQQPLTFGTQNTQMNFQCSTKCSKSKKCKVS